MPDLSWWEKLRGKRTHDIELPPESGEVDPMLAGKDADTKVQKAKVKAFADSNKAALQGLYSAAKEK